MIALAKLLSYLDKLEASFRSAEAISRQTELQLLPPILIGGDGSSGHTQYGAGDGTFITTMNGPTLSMIAASAPNVINSAIYSAWLSSLAAYLKTNAPGTFGASPITTLDLYLSQQNALTRDSALVGPSTALLQWLAGNSAASLRLSPGNVFAPITQLCTVTVGASAALTKTTVGSILTANDVVNNLQGYTPAPGLSATITTAIGGTLALTVTATGRTAAGMLVSGRTWTGTLDSAAAGTVITLTPSVLGDRIASVTSVSGAGTAGSGAFSLQSVIERVVS